MDQHVQIGHVAEATGLSLRTIRYYEEVGLVTPSGRTSGGFRLYSDVDVERLLLVKRMKPLGYPLDEMRRLLELLDGMAGEDPQRREESTRLLDGYIHEVETRIQTLRTQTEYAEEFLSRLQARTRQTQPVEQRTAGPRRTVQAEA